MTNEERIARLREMAEEQRKVSEVSADLAKSFEADGVAATAKSLYGCSELSAGDQKLLFAAADALEREAWCEEKKVDLIYENDKDHWVVYPYYGGIKTCRSSMHGKTRAAAIDAARGAK